MRRLLVGLAVLGALLAVADRVAAAVAAGAAARLVQRAEDLREAPDVTFHGFPFLTQALRGRFARVDVTARGLTRADLTFARATARLTGVRIGLRDVFADDARPVRIDRGELTASLPYGEVDRYLADRPGRPRVRPVGDGGLEARATVDVPGAGPTEVVGTGTVTVAGERLRLRIDSVALGSGGPVPAAARAAALSRLAVVIPLRDLPFGIRVVGVRAGPDGLVVAARGERIVTEPRRRGLNAAVGPGR